MIPMCSCHDSRNGGLANVIFLGESAVGLSRLRFAPNGSHVVISQFCAAVPYARAGRVVQAGASRVLDVLKVRQVFKIVQSWIHLVSVAVVDLATFGRWPHESRRNEHMDAAGEALTIASKAERGIPDPVGILSQDQPDAGSVSTPDITDTPKVRDFIQTLEADDGAPFFARGILWFSHAVFSFQNRVGLEPVSSVQLLQARSILPPIAAIEAKLKQVDDLLGVEP